MVCKRDNSNNQWKVIGNNALMARIYLRLVLGNTTRQGEWGGGQIGVPIVIVLEMFISEEQMQGYHLAVYPQLILKAEIRGGCPGT